ncbi:MAG TPA: Fur family transcriptional regulator [Solirubrobacteraceae bacterium]|nr:Fur family transcriptional regulator [Solirubrobacteraceae bacterium]
MARATRQRAEVLDALEHASMPVSAQDLFVRLRGEGAAISLATVYRQLQRLADEGVADRIARDSGELSFRLCGTGHHHHLVCRECGRTEEVRDCRLDRWAREIADQHGFSAVDHRADFTGVCARCSG